MKCVRLTRRVLKPRNFFLSLSGTLSIFLFASGLKAQTFNGPGFTIVDGGARVATSCSIVPVSGITGNVSVRSISLNNVNHTWLGDLEVRVYPPGSTPPPSTAAPSVVISSPPDGRACNLAGTYRFMDTFTPVSIDQATVGCADATNLAPGTYSASNYGGGTNPGTIKSVRNSFGTLGSLTPAQANGNWLVCVFDFATPDGGTVGSTSIEFIGPTAASISLGGRVLTPEGRGIGNTIVTLSDQAGTTRSAMTNPFGYYRFDGIEAGANYIIAVSSKSYTFEIPTVVHHALEDTEGINFIANP